MTAANDYNALVIYRVGPVRCCSPCEPVVTVTPPPQLTPPPGSSRCRPGIFRHGQLLVSVLDLRLAFGVDEQHWQRPGRIIISQVAGGHTGFWVDEIIEVMETPGAGWGALPPHLPRGLFSKTLLLNNEIHLYTEFDKLNTLNSPGCLRRYIEQLTQAADTHKERAQGRPNTGRQATRPVRSGSGTRVPGSGAGPVQRASQSPGPPKPGNARQTKTSFSSAANPTAAGVARGPSRQTVSTPSADKADTAAPAIKAPPTDARRASATRIEPANRGNQDEVSGNVTRGAAAPRNAPATTASRPKPTSSLAGPGRHPHPDAAASRRVAHSEPAMQDSPYGGMLLLLGVVLLMLGGGGYWLYDLMRTPLGEADRLAAQATTMPNTALPPSTNTRRTGKAAADPSDAPSPGVQQSLPASPRRGHRTPPAGIQAVATSPAGGSQARPPGHAPARETAASEAFAGTGTGTAPDLNAGAAIAGQSTEPTHRETTVAAMHRPPGDSLQAGKTNDNPGTRGAVEREADAERAGDEQRAPAALDAGDSAPRAIIERDARGITIILEDTGDAPVLKAGVAIDERLSLTEAPAFTPLPGLSARQPNGRPNQGPLRGNDTRAPQAPPAATPSDSGARVAGRGPSMQTVVHIVVKGDTLWDIAGRYVNDPLRYPELARLSGIDNPHLIYPGDRVRIVSHGRPGNDTEP